MHSKEFTTFPAYGIYINQLPGACEGDGGKCLLVYHIVCYDMAPPAALQEDIDGYCGDSLIGISIAIAAVQAIVVAARFYTRFLQRVKCGLDDYLIILALVSPSVVVVVIDRILTLTRRPV